MPILGELLSAHDGLEKAIRHIIEDKDAEIYRDILRWAIKEGPQMEGFRLRELTNWLIDNHKPFVQEYAGSNIPKSYRAHSKGTFVRDRIELLNLCGEMVHFKGVAKSQKNNSDTPIYEFTDDAILLAWIIQTRHGNPTQREFALDKVKEFVVNHIYNKDHSFSQFLLKYLEVMEARGQLQEAMTSLVETIIEKWHHGDMTETNDFYEILEHYFIENVLYQINISKHVLSLLDERTEKMFLMQLKLMLEESNNNFFANAEWEAERLKNVANHEVVTMQAFCEFCRITYPAVIEIWELLKARAAHRHEPWNYICKQCGDLTLDL